MDTTKTRLFPFWEFIFVLVTALGISIFFHFYYHNIADPDSFYHARHALDYTQHPFDSSTGWMKFSNIATEKSDIWYGFHLALSPFVAGGGIDIGIRVAGVALTTLFLFAIYFVAKRHELPAPWLWPFVAFFILPNAMYFFVMIRPHMLSLVCALLLASFLVRGKPWQLALTSGLITFFHGSFFWLPFFVLGAHLGASLTQNKLQKLKVDWVTLLHKIAWVTGGMLIGLFSRPHPIGGLKLAWTQIITLSHLGASGVPTMSGTELLPLGVHVFSTATIMFVLFLITLYLGNKYFFKRNMSTERQLLLGMLLVLSFVFGFLTIFVAIRFFILWISFGVLAFAVSTKEGGWLSKHTQIAAVIFLIIILVPYALHRHKLNEKYVATSPEKFELATMWLKDHSKPGDLVFNTHWDQFGSLIHFDTKNVYVGGMHPVFQYAYSKDLYWKFYYISQDIGGSLTCGAFPCNKEQMLSTYDVLKNDFRAKYVFVEILKNPNLRAYLSTDPHFTLGYADRQVEIYEVR